MDRERYLDIKLAKELSRDSMSPCNDCEVGVPLTCGKQYLAPSPDSKSDVMCIVKGRVKLIGPRFIRIERNGNASANREVSQAAKAAL